MRTIYKYPIRSVGEQVFNLPRHAKFLHVGWDPSETLNIWAEIDTDFPMEERFVYVYGTGFEIKEDPNLISYLGTVTCDSFIWHVYYEKLPHQ